MSDWIKEVAALNCKEVIERVAGVQFNRYGKTHCPLPGHFEKTPSFSLIKSTNKWKCFGCEQGGDCIDFVAKFKGVDNTEAAKYLADLYGVAQAVSHGKSKADKVTAKPAMPPQEPNVRLKTDITEYIKACEQNIDRTDYFKMRGLTEATIKHFHLGYDAKKDCVVIPYSSKLDYYQTRSVEGKKFYKPPTEQAGQEPIYNIAVLKNGGYIFVVESAICAMSIVQCGGLAIALGGTGIQKLLAEAKGEKNNCVFILCLDNDDAGQKIQQSLANQLFEQSIKFIASNISGEHKDPNALLMADPKALVKNIKAALKDADEKHRTEYDSFSATDLMKEKLPPVTWVVEKFLREGVHFLCASPKIGKSYMVMQLGLAVTQGKDFLGMQCNQCGCLYYAIEDGKQRLQERLQKALKGMAPPPNLHFSIKSKRADKGLFEQLERELAKHKDVRLIIFDTFQKIRGNASKDLSAYAQDYEEVAQFMEFIKKHPRMAILFVHHLRKMIDESDVFNMISGSTALFGAADTSIIIYKRKRNDTETIMTMTGRDIDLADMTLTRDKETGFWELLGTTEEMDRRRARDEFNSDPVVKVVKALCEANTYGRWQGNATDFIMDSCDVLGHCINETPSGLGQKFGKLRPMLYESGIRYTPPTSHGKKMKHTFQLKSKEVYQQRFFGSKDEGNEG